MNEKEFKDGFNNGYLLAEFQMDLFNKIEKSLSPENGYVQGLLAGKEQYQADKTKDLLQEFDRIRMRGREDRNREMDLERER